MEIAKFINNHIHTISLTRLDNNTIATLCEYNLYVETQNLIHYKLYLMKS
nr:hypothetical protein [Clostridioides difficile]